VSSPHLEPLHELARTWRATTRASKRWVAIALVALVWVVALLGARYGTGRARLGASLAMAVGVAAAVGWRIAERRRLSDPRSIVRGLAAGLDTERADRALRALTLIPRTVVGPIGSTSLELAHLHVSRAIAQLPAERIAERAKQTAVWAERAALAVGIVALGLALANAWSVLEGADVLIARRGVAPVAMQWLGDVEVMARPPDYLHQPEVHDAGLSPLVLPYGTVVTVRGVPLRPGRTLLLSDGTTEAPFVEDGAGALVARWTLHTSASVQIVARFGNVVVPAPDPLGLEAVPDQAPVVILEGAPRSIALVDATEEDVPIKYEASDDHGLREVHLVLRSGVREERRVLAHLDGATLFDTGGRVLRLRDPFLKKSHAPVEVTVEAKDNDPLTGPKWGKSAAFTLIPPDVGDPEARRLDALRRLRDALVDTLAFRLMNDVPSDAAGRRAYAADEKRRAVEDDTRVLSTLDGSYGGIRIPGRLRALLVAQQQKTRKAVDAEVRDPTAAKHASAVSATERFVLVVDAVVRGLGIADTRAAARQLADVADDLALGAVQMQSDASGERTRGEARSDAATLVLANGGRVMLRLGALGHDLGEIIDSDLSRVKRARDAIDLVHAELAARDLAARLHEPDPSFGARSRMGKAGGESGGARGTPGEEGGDSGDEVDQAQQEAAQDLERLAQEHAGEIGKTEQALAQAASNEELKALKEEAQRHIDAIRGAARTLPSVGKGSDSWTSKGAAARELAEQMARSLEQMRPDEAVESGRSALGALDEAKRLLQRGSWLDDPAGEHQKRVEDARRTLESEQDWVEKMLGQMRKKIAERARAQLEQGGEEEAKLAERAGDLGRKAREQGSLPEEAVESLEEAERAARQAADALRQGDADKGLERQRAAQRDLEAAREQLQGEDEDGRPSASDQSDNGKMSDARVLVPKAGEHKGPEEFRRRVVHGLGQPASGALKDAVRRYAEGLLR
jgi:hypothetical protein